MSGSPTAFYIYSTSRSILGETISPDVALIFVEPRATAVARPLEPAALLITATAGVDEDQVTNAVRFCVVPFEYVPVAVYGTVALTATVKLIGVTAIETSVAEVTVRFAVPEMRPDVAVIVVEPAATVLAKPFDPAMLLMVATDGEDELQVTDDVRF